MLNCRAPLHVCFGILFLIIIFFFFSNLWHDIFCTTIMQPPLIRFLFHLKQWIFLYLLVCGHFFLQLLILGFLFASLFCYVNVVSKLLEDLIWNWRLHIHSVLWFINYKVPINFQLKLSTLWLIICILRINLVIKLNFL